MDNGKLTMDNSQFSISTYPLMKDSGVEWIGEIPDGWEVKKIKHRCYVKGRVGWKGLKSSEFLIDGFSYLVTGTDFKDGKVYWKGCYHIDKERYKEDPFIQLQDNDLLITKDGTIGKLAIVDNLDKPACLNSGIFVVRSLNDDFTTRYLFWMLTSDVFTKFNEYTSYGSTIQHLYQNVFVEFAFSFPTREDQTAIANYLDCKTAEIDELIAQKERLLELYEEEKTAIINQAVTKGIDPDVKLKDSGIDWLGEIPAGWEIKKLKYAFNFHDNQRIPLSAVVRGKMLIKEYDYYGASGVIDKVENYLFEGEYILLGEDGANLLTRNTALAFKATGKFWVNNHAHILTPKTGNIDFSTHLLENIDYTMWVSGSAQPKLTAEALGNVDVSFPEPDEQTAIVHQIKTETTRINAKIAKTKKIIELQKEYRTALISEVVTGKIKVTQEETHKKYLSV